MQQRTFPFKNNKLKYISKTDVNNSNKEKEKDVHLNKNVIIKHKDVKFVSSLKKVRNYY